ncbi:MAG: T9SS type A sorting domain-containing protein [Salibacteraceae bacterium]|mgnify:CR=1 FL=1
MKKRYTLSALALLVSMGASLNGKAQVTIEGDHVSLDQYPKYEEVVSQRGAQERTFQGPDGRYIKQQSGGFLNYQNNSGNWTPIDDRLVQNGQTLEVASTGLPISLDLTSGATQMTLEGGQFIAYGDQLSITLQSVSGEAYHTLNATTGTQQVVNGKEITFNDAWPGIDRHQRIEYYLVETDYILGAQPAMGNPGEVMLFNDVVTLPAGWTFRNGVGFHSQYGWQGTLDILNAQGQRVGGYELPIYYDNSNKKGSDHWMHGSYVLHHHPANNQWDVAVAVPVDWLLDGDRVYPVTIDPSILNTYNTGAILNNFNMPSATCNGILTFTVPMASNVDFLNTSYTMIAQSGAFLSEQEASIIGPTATFGTTGMGGFTGGTQTWTLNNLNIANGAVAGTSVDIEIQPWRTWGGTLCDSIYQYIPNNTWSVELFFNLPAPPTGIVGPAAICLGDSALFTGTGIIDTLQWFTGACGANAGGTFIGQGDSIFLAPTSTTTYFIRNATSGGDFSACFDFTVIVSEPATSITSVTDVTCNAGMDGQAEVSASGGLGPYTYTWLSSGTVNAIDSNLMAGTYQVATMDTLGCEDTLGVVVGEPAAVATMANVTGISCAGDTNGMIEVTDISGGTPFGGYVLETAGQYGPLNGTGTNVPLGDDVVSPAIALPFTFKFYDVDYTDVYISSNGFLAFDPGTPSGCCTGQNLPNPFTPNNVIAFAWEDLNTNTGSGAVEYYTVGTAPNRVFVVEFNNVHLCCGTATPTITTQIHLHETTNRIEIHTAQAIFTGFNNATMGIENSLGSLALTVPGRNSQTWDTIINDYVAFVPTLPYQLGWSNGDSVGTLDSLGGGTYTVTITDAAGCTALDSFSIVVPDPVTVNLTSTDITCFGDNNGMANVSAMGGTMPYDFMWSDGDSATSKMNLTPNTMLSVTVTDANGCQDSSATITINEPTQVMASISNSIDVFCAGDATGSASAMGAGGTPPYNYIWDDANSQSTQQASNLSSGTYNVTVTDDNGCTSTTNIAITDVNALPVVSLGNDTTINDGFLVLDPGPGFIAYQWLNGTTNQTLSVTSTGTYWVIVTDGNGCTNADSINVIVETPVGIAEINNNPLSVYPNPSNGEFFLNSLKGEQEVALSVMDIKGRTVWAKTLNMTAGQTEILNLEDQAQGVYIMSVTTADETFQYRLIVE